MDKNDSSENRKKNDEEIDFTSFWADDDDLSDYAQTDDDHIKNAANENLLDDRGYINDSDVNSDADYRSDKYDRYSEKNIFSPDEFSFESDEGKRSFEPENFEDPGSAESKDKPYEDVENDGDVQRRDEKSSFNLFNAVKGVAAALLLPVKLLTGGKSEMRSPEKNKRLPLIFGGVVFVAALAIAFMYIGKMNELRNVQDPGATQANAGRVEGEKVGGDKTTDSSKMEVADSSIYGIWVSLDEKTVFQIDKDGTYRKVSSAKRGGGSVSTGDAGISDAGSDLLNADVSDVPALGTYDLIGDGIIQFSDGDSVFKMKYDVDGVKMSIAGYGYEKYTDIDFDKIVKIPVYYKSGGKYKILKDRYSLGVVKSKKTGSGKVNLDGYVEIYDFTGKSRIYAGAMKNGCLNGKGSLYSANQPVFTGRFKDNRIVY